MPQWIWLWMNILEQYGFKPMANQQLEQNSRSCSTQTDDFHKRIKKLSESVAHFWGNNLPITVSAETSSFNWMAVNISEHLSYLSDQCLTALLLHEWGHRMISPVTVEQAYWWEILAAQAGIKETAEAVNIATDLIVDYYYLNHKLWANQYQNCEKKLIDEFDFGDPVKEFYLQCYLYMAKWEDDFPHLWSNKDSVKRAVDVLLNENSVLDKRIRQFFQILANIFRLRNQSSREIALIIIRGTSAQSIAPYMKGELAPWKNKSFDVNRLIRLIKSSGDKFPIKQIEDICGKNNAHQIIARLNILESLVRVESKVTRKINDKRTQHREGVSVWQVGESIKKLDVLATLERSGLLLPEITTLKNLYPQTQVKNPPGSVCLIIDNSNSTSGLIIQSELDASIALIEASRRLKMDVSAIVFGSDVTASIEPGSEYDRIERLLAELDGQSGGTRLSPALDKAISFAGMQKKKMSTVIFSDSYIFDTRESIERITTLQKKGPVIMFLVEQKLNMDYLEDLKKMDSPPKILSFKPGQMLVDEALDAL